MAAKKRELIDTGSNKEYVRRDGKGQFTAHQVDVGKSLVADRRQHSDTNAGPREGDKGDRPRKS